MNTSDNVKNQQTASVRKRHPVLSGVKWLLIIAPWMIIIWQAYTFVFPDYENTWKVPKVPLAQKQATAELKRGMGLLTGKEPVARAEGVRLVVRHGNEATGDDLWRLVEKAEEPEVRTAAILALKELHNRNRALEMLRESADAQGHIFAAGMPVNSKTGLHVLYSFFVTIRVKVSQTVRYPDSLLVKVEIGKGKGRRRLKLCRTFGEIWAMESGNKMTQIPAAFIEELSSQIYPGAQYGAADAFLLTGKDFFWKGENQGEKDTIARVDVTYPNGDLFELYFSRTTRMLVRSVLHTKDYEKKDQEVVRIYEYRERVNDLKIANHVVVYINGQQARDETVKQVKFNSELKEGVFDKPY